MGADHQLFFDGIVDARGQDNTSGLYYSAEADIRIADSLGNTIAGTSDDVAAFTELYAGGRIDITGKIDTSATGEGADIHIDAGTGVRIHPTGILQSKATGPGGVTGLFEIATSSGDIVHEGQLIGTPASALEQGAGAGVTMYASDGSISLYGTIDMAAGNNSFSFESTFDASDDVTQHPGATIKAGSKGPQGQGEMIQFFGRHVALYDDVDISGGGGGTDTIRIIADLSATVTGKLKANASNGGDAGGIEIHACDVTIADGAKLEAIAGSIGLEGGRRVLVVGQLKAGSSNTIEYDLNYPELLGNVSPTATVSPTADSLGCASLAMCGNDLLDVGEQCDDGNVADGDCCSAACAAEPLGDPCGLEWGLCATNQCDGLGGCGIATPGAGCWQPVTALRSQLSISDKSVDKGDLVAFRWLAGDEVPLGSLPDPVNADDVELCIYGPGGRAPLPRAPAGGTCAGKACWKASSTVLV